jgi:outer membrane receptor protein involved in Fe transport
MKIETGLSFHGYTRFIDVTFTNYDYNSSAWIIDPTFTNQFDFTENIYAGYALMSTQAGGFNLSAGLRTEFMDRELYQKTNGDAFPYSKLHFFPSCSASKELENKQSVQFSYSHRINRPDEYMMNPFPEASDSYFYSTGNPLLIPEISHSFEFTYQKYLEKGMLSAQAYYKQTDDRLGQTLTLMDNNVIYLIMDNNSMDKTYGSDLLANYNPTKWWSVNATTSLYQYFISGEIEGISFERNSFQWSSQLVNSFNFKTKTSLQLIGMYNSKTLRSQGELSDYYMLDIALNQTFFNDKLSVSIQMKDVLQSLNYDLYTEHENMQLTGYFKNESPTFLLNISYSFNNFKKMTKDVETEFDM